MSSLRDRIVTRVWRDTAQHGWRVETQGGRTYGPFETEYEMAQNPEIGQRAKNWLEAQGGRTASRMRAGEAP